MFLLQAGGVGGAAGGPCGCTQYEFDLIEPADLAQRVGRQSAATVEVAPLQYRLQSVDGRLVMQIFNPTD